MAAKLEISMKQIKIDKANQVMVGIIGVASFLVIFALVASKSLLSEYSYQNKVISAKKIAVNQLKSDVSATGDLVSSYKAFVNTPQNILDGNSNGANQNDGDNATIILDALPSVYDFPNLISSVQNMFGGQPYKINSITGTDESLSLKSQNSSQKSSPVQIPLQINATGNYQAIQSFINRLQLSIRPFQVQSIDLSGSDKTLTATISVITYYQPGVEFKIGSETIQ